MYLTYIVEVTRLEKKLYSYCKNLQNTCKQHSYNLTKMITNLHAAKIESVVRFNNYVR